MKKIIEKEVSVCDRCGKDEHVYNKCNKCGIEHCYDCHKLYGHEYQHGVHFSGSGDGYYCEECDMSLRQTKDNELYNAYQKIQQLREEERVFYEKFKAKTEHAECLIKFLTDEK